MLENEDNQLDFEAKAQNINLRITPSMKSLIIRNAKKLGLSMTDYIEHCVQHSSDSDKALEQLKLYKSQSERYDKMIAEYQQFFEIVNNGKNATSYELYVEIMRTFKAFKTTAENNAIKNK